ncbi:MAG: Mu transposase domain-containing protein [Candidatus Xenobia bacterium]
MLPLPPRPYVRSKETFRKVGSDGFVTYAGDSYSVPPFYAGQSVWVRRRDNRIDICLQSGNHIASHPPGDGRGLVRRPSCPSWQRARTWPSTGAPPVSSPPPPHPRGHRRTGSCCSLHAALPPRLLPGWPGYGVPAISGIPPAGHPGWPETSRGSRSTTRRTS